MRFVNFDPKYIEVTLRGNFACSMYGKYIISFNNVKFFVSPFGETWQSNLPLQRLHTK